MKIQLQPVMALISYTEQYTVTVVAIYAQKYKHFIFKKKTKMNKQEDLRKIKPLEKVFLFLDISVIYAIFFIVNIFLSDIDMVLDVVFGLSFKKGSKKERWNAKQGGRTAQVVRAWQVFTFDIFSKVYLSNFFYTHDKYVSPDIVLHDPKALLFAYTEEYVLFTYNETDLLDVNTYPFLFVFQVLKAKRLIVVQTNEAMRLAHQVGKPKVPVSIILMPGRSGSTLLCQMLQKVPGTRVIAEPISFVYARSLYNKGQLNLAGFKHSVGFMYKLLCKVEPNSDVKRIIIKTMPAWAQEVMIIKENFPECRLIYSARGLKEALASQQRNISGLFKLSAYNRWNFGFKDHFDSTQFRFDDNNAQKDHVYKNLKLRNSLSLELNALSQGLTLQIYLRNKDKFEMVVFYEDLISNPIKITRTLFEKLQVPLDFVDEALMAMKTDSQRGFLPKPSHEHDTPLDFSTADYVFTLLDLNLTHKISLEDFKKLFN